MIFMQHIWTVKINIHTFERNAIEIDDRETIHNIFTDTLIFFYRKSSQERTHISCGDR